MTQHTPGPWTISAGGPWEEIDASKSYVFIHAEAWAALARVVVRLDDDIKTSPEGEANARLIAAAPDMLRALTLIANGSVDAQGIACDAIAKAAGGELIRKVNATREELRDAIAVQDAVAQAIKANNKI